MNHSEDASNWQFGPGSLDSGPEDDDVFDYSKLLARESNSEPGRQARADAGSGDRRSLSKRRPAASKRAT
jgi:hypothetical protein